jgi:hypothetical protein
VIEVICISAVCILILFMWQRNLYDSNKAFQLERDNWIKERKDLMDRLQAPTFADYTNKVVREKKLEQPQEEEKPAEFIS